MLNYGGEKNTEEIQESLTFNTTSQVEKDLIQKN